CSLASLAAFSASFFFAAAESSCMLMDLTSPSASSRRARAPWDSLRPEAVDFSTSLSSFRASRASAWRSLISLASLARSSLMAACFSRSAWRSASARSRAALASAAFASASAALRARSSSCSRRRRSRGSSTTSSTACRRPRCVPGRGGGAAS
ncbi:hypothetical protein Vretifemale_5531, partial [Volvox reticuliferus]